ncbi:MAG: transposase family protein [Colwellia sp.]|nr:transposase family protein [Colwellia sp.]
MPESIKGNKYVLLMVDLLSKWPEAVPLPEITADIVVQSIVNSLICKHGVPQILISDNGTQFTSGIMADVCKDLQIKHKMTLTYHP